MSKGARQTKRIKKKRKKFSHLTCEDGEIGKRNGLKIRQSVMTLRVRFPLFAPNYAPIVQWLVHLAYIQLIGVRVPVGVPLFMPNGEVNVSSFLATTYYLFRFVFSFWFLSFSFISSNSV